VDWSAVWTELPKAVGPFVGTVVGGLLAILGGVIGGYLGQYLTHRYTRARETEKLLREKAEQLIHELYAHRDWVVAFHNAVAIEGQHRETASPLEQILTLQRLHFPELREQINAMQQAVGPLVSFSYEQRVRHLQDRETWRAQSEQVHTEWIRMYEPYINSSETAIRAVVAAVEKRLGN
jgi:hypothetical protein